MGETLRFPEGSGLTGLLVYTSVSALLPYPAPDMGVSEMGALMIIHFSFFLLGNTIPKSVKRIHSATRNIVP